MTQFFSILRSGLSSKNHADVRLQPHGRTMETLNFQILDVRRPITAPRATHGLSNAHRTLEPPARAFLETIEALVTFHRDLNCITGDCEIQNKEPKQSKSRATAAATMLVFIDDRSQRNDHNGAAIAKKGRPDVVCRWRLFGGVMNATCSSVHAGDPLGKIKGKYSDGEVHQKFTLYVILEHCS